MSNEYLSIQPIVFVALRQCFTTASAQSVISLYREWYSSSKWKIWALKCLSKTALSTWSNSLCCSIQGCAVDQQARCKRRCILGHPRSYLNKVTSIPNQNNLAIQSGQTFQTFQMSITQTISARSPWRFAHHAFQLYVLLLLRSKDPCIWGPSRQLPNSSCWAA